MTLLLRYLILLCPCDDTMLWAGFSLVLPPDLAATVRFV